MFRRSEMMKNQYSAMTVNERLYASGKMDEFDKAILEKNIDQVIAILKSVHLNDESISSILIHLGLSKTKI